MVVGPRGSPSVAMVFCLRHLKEKKLKGECILTIKKEFCSKSYTKNIEKIIWHGLIRKKMSQNKFSRPMRPIKAEQI